MLSVLQFFTVTLFLSPERILYIFGILYPSTLPFLPVLPQKRLALTP